MAVVFCASAGHASAQQSVASALTFLVTNQSVDTGSVERDAAAAQATSDTISRALLANLATLPVTSTSGAFIYRLNPTIGTVERPKVHVPLRVRRDGPPADGAGLAGVARPQINPLLRPEFAVHSGVAAIVGERAQDVPPRQTQGRRLERD